MVRFLADREWGDEPVAVAGRVNVPPRAADAQAPLVGSHAWAAKPPPPGSRWLGAPFSPRGALTQEELLLRNARVEVGA
eukprot:14553101-Alexandrium_andersonii.AAC.1